MQHFDVEARRDLILRAQDLRRVKMAGRAIHLDKTVGARAIHVRTICGQIEGLGEGVEYLNAGDPHGILAIAPRRGVEPTFFNRNTPPTARLLRFVVDSESYGPKLRERIIVLAY